MTNTHVRDTRRWVLIGTLGWVTLAAVYTLSTALRAASHGLPFLASWRSVTSPLLVMLAGALLTPAVVAAFARGPARAARRTHALLGYVAIGIAYWLVWSGLVASLTATGLIRASPPVLSGAIVLMAYISLAAYAVMVMLYEAVRSLRRAREQEIEAAQLQAELARAQAATLRARLNPAFLFDAFDTASQLMDANARAARRVLADLGALLRASLGQHGSDLVSCQDEVELLERYLDIRRARPDSRLRVRVHVEPAAADARLPVLLLQPVAEALLRNGAGPNDDDEQLEVTARRIGAELRIALVGSGGRLHAAHAAATAAAAGFPDAADAQDAADAADAADGPDGALHAARARLRAVYGDAAGVAVRRAEGGGVRVELRVPQPPGEVADA